MKINRLILFALLLASLVLSACQSDASQDSAITISGAWALYPMMVRWAEEYQKINPKVTFDISAGGAGKGMADALSGAADIGMVSRDITPEEEGKGAAWFAVTKDAVFPMISDKNPLKDDLLSMGLNQEQFVNIFVTGESKAWGELVGKPELSEQINTYTRSDACGAAETWAKYLGKKQEDLLGIGIFGDPGLLDAVIKDPLGIGYNNLGYAFDNDTGKPVTGALPLPIDVNGNGKADPEEILETKEEAVQAVASGKYPSPPARALNLVTNGKPDGVVADFIEWILTDGQQYVSEAGYVQLTQEQLDGSVQKLK